MAQLVFDCGLDGLSFRGQSLTKVQFADECDLSKIIKRFVRTGELPNTHVRTPIAMTDITKVPTDFCELMNDQVAIKQEFEQLPLVERNKFNNDPQAWLEQKIIDADESNKQLEVTSSAEPIQPAVDSSVAPVDTVAH